jgi:hypothetical protein
MADGLAKLPQIGSCVDGAVVFRHLQDVVYPRVVMKLIFDGGERGFRLSVGYMACNNGNHADSRGEFVVDPVRELPKQQSSIRRVLPG